MAAAEITSAYTELDLDTCRLAEEASEGEGAWARWECPGYGGMTVHVSEDDLRYAVSYGPAAEIQCAAQQSFQKFNHLGLRIEWRLIGGRPFATILRWYQSADGVKTNWLVVSKVDRDEACAVAYVDPAVPEANEVARQKADTLARSFRCAADMPVIVSLQTITVEELVSGWPCPVE